MLLLLVLFPLFAFSEDMASEKYCFSVTGEAAAKKFSAIQVPSDVVTQDGNCLVIQMRPHRRELVQRFLLSSVPGASVAFSSEEVRREPCRLKVEKIKTSKGERVSGGINQHQIQVNQNQFKGYGNEVMQIETLSDFQLSVNQDEIVGNCRYITPRRYEIAIEVKKNPKPIVPQELPPGSIVVLQGPPPDQETMSLKTVLQLNQGDRIEIGEIVRKLKDKNHSLNINPTVTIETDRKNESEKVFLSLQ